LHQGALTEFIIEAGCVLSEQLEYLRVSEKQLLFILLSGALVQVVKSCIQESGGLIRSQARVLDLGGSTTEFMLRPIEGGDTVVVTLACRAIL
jgi:hypothetical protein